MDFQCRLWDFHRCPLSCVWFPFVFMLPLDFHSISMKSNCVFICVVFPCLDVCSDEFGFCFCLVWFCVPPHIKNFVRFWYVWLVGWLVAPPRRAVQPDPWPPDQTHSMIWPHEKMEPIWRELLHRTSYTIPNASAISIIILHIINNEVKWSNHTISQRSYSINNCTMSIIRHYQYLIMAIAYTTFNCF